MPDLVCDCNICWNGGMCWKAHEIQEAKERALWIKQRVDSKKKKVNWWDEFPELILWDSLPRVIYTWQRMQAYMYCVHCYDN